MFDDILKKTKEGKALTKKEIKQLARYFGILNSWIKIVTFIIHALIIIFLLALSFGFLWIEVNVYLLIIPFVYLVVVGIINYNIPYYKRVIDYFCAIDEVYNRKLADYVGYTIAITTNIPISNGYLQKDIILLATDNYNFICYDDYLIPTEYELKTYKPSKKVYRVLKVIDDKSIDKKPFIFKLQDIISYSYIEETDIKQNYEYDYKDYSILISPIEYKRYVKIDLKDYSSLKFGINVLEILRASAPLKEKDNNESKIS